jgi:hypothetical protein
VSANIEQLPAEWPATRLESLDRGGTGMFALGVGPSPPDFWLLAQGSRPVGIIKRPDAGTRLRTAADEWRMRVLRPKRLAWQLIFVPASGREELLRYTPRTLRQGGSLEISGGARYELRGPLLRADWRLVAAKGSEIAHIAFRGQRPVEPGFRYRLGLSIEAAQEPLLPVVLLAAGGAILVHYYEHRLLPTGNI